MSGFRCRTTVIGSLAAVTLALALTTGASQPPATPAKKIFSTLKVGQSVTLRDKGPAWEIHTMDDAPLTHKVADLGEDYIVVHDEPGAIEFRIPVTAVRAVVHVRAKRK